VNRPALHVCNATGQNLASLIPALQLGATDVVILETGAMRESASSLKRALQARGVRVRRIPIDDATAESIGRSADSVAIELSERQRRLVLNVTGSHPFLALALVEKLTLVDELHVLHTEICEDRLNWCRPEPLTEPMADVLRLEDVILSQGFRLARSGDRDVLSMRRAGEREALTRRLGDQADRLAGLFGALNHLAGEALADEANGSFRPQQNLQYPPKDGRVLRDAETIGLLKWDGATEVVFASDHAAHCFNGGWLEEYVTLKLRGLEPKDWACHIQIDNVSTGEPNRFDALAVHRNRVLVIECTTSSFGRSSAKDADDLLKLTELARTVGGITASSLLLSAQPLAGEVRRRATTNGVSLLAAAEVRDLVGFLRNWMRAS